MASPSVDFRASVMCAAVSIGKSAYPICVNNWAHYCLGLYVSTMFRLTRSLCRRQNLRNVRTHMNHGGGDIGIVTVNPSMGPLKLGLEAARGSENVLRLLESSHGNVQWRSADTLDTVWYSRGLIWRRTNNEWSASLPGEQGDDFAIKQHPSLLSVTLSDDRTALAKVLGLDGCERYISMLRIDTDNWSRPMNDGWRIVREVVGGDHAHMDETAHGSVAQVLQRYLRIEHGGGSRDFEMANEMFADKASLLSIGTAAEEDEPGDWSAPMGTVLEIDREVYLEGVYTQTPHAKDAAHHDVICNVDVLSCGTAAAATVLVGNGAMDRVFCDHLLLGKKGNKEWHVLSKTFSTRPWPHKH